MPLLNPGRVIASPMIGQSRFAVRRRIEVINEHGRNAEQNTTIPGVYGICDVDGDNHSDRGEDQTSSRKSIAIFTKFALRGESKDYKQDIVIYRGNEFLIETVDDFLDFGEGWIEAHGATQAMLAKPPGVLA